MTSLETLQAMGYTAARPDPRWSLLVAETRTGRVTGTLPLAGLSWALPLQWGGTHTMRVVIPLDGPPGADERSTTTRVKAIAAGPWRFMLVAVYGQTPVAWGYAGPPRPGAEGTVEIGCSDLYALLNRRVVVATGQRGNLNSVAADTILGPSTVPNIARALMFQGCSEPGQELPLDVSVVGIVGDQTRSYLATDLGTYAQRIQQLTNEQAGPDIIVSPRLSVDRTQVTLRVDIGEPYLGQSGSPWAWNLPGNCVDVEIDVDPSGMADSIFVPGNGVDKGKPIGSSFGSTLVDAGFPAMDFVDTGYGSVDDRSILDGIAAGAANIRRSPLESWRLQVRANADPQLGTYRRGDTVSVRTSGHYWLGTGTHQRRIVAVSGDHTDMVNVETAPVPAAL